MNPDEMIRRLGEQAARVSTDELEGAIRQFTLALPEGGIDAATLWLLKELSARSELKFPGMELHPSVLGGYAIGRRILHTHGRSLAYSGDTEAQLLQTIERVQIYYHAIVLSEFLVHAPNVEEFIECQSRRGLEVHSCPQIKERIASNNDFCIREGIRAALTEHFVVVEAAEEASPDATSVLSALPEEVQEYSVIKKGDDDRLLCLVRWHPRGTPYDVLLVHSRHRRLPWAVLPTTTIRGYAESVRGAAHRTLQEAVTDVLASRTVMEQMLNVGAIPQRNEALLAHFDAGVIPEALVEVAEAGRDMASQGRGTPDVHRPGGCLLALVMLGIGGVVLLLA